MADSIVEQLLQNIGTRLTEIRTVNLYETEMGAAVVRHFVPALNSEIVPCVGYATELLENSALYARKEDNILPVRVQGIANFSDSVPASVVAVKIHADIVECMLASEITINFLSGGTDEISVADRVTDAQSGATGLVIAVSVSSGTWAGGNAAGSLLIRRLTGDFQAGSNLNVGLVTNIATISGSPTWQDPCELSTGDIAEAITFLTSQFFMPEADNITTGCSVVFAVRFKSLSGNPYSQT